MRNLLFGIVDFLISWLSTNPDYSKSILIDELRNFKIYIFEQIDN